MANIVPAVMVVSTDTVSSKLLSKPKPKPGMISAPVSVAKLKMLICPSACKTAIGIAT